MHFRDAWQNAEAQHKSNVGLAPIQPINKPLFKPQGGPARRLAL
jgi:hypothetical protein